MTASTSGIIHAVAGMAELVDAADSKSAAERLVGSSPTSGTTSHESKLVLTPPFGVRRG